MKGVRLDDNDEGFYQKFSTGSVAIPWQTEVRMFLRERLLTLPAGSQKLVIIHQRVHRERNTRRGPPPLAIISETHAQSSTNLNLHPQYLQSVHTGKIQY